MTYRERQDRTTKNTHAKAMRDGTPMTWAEARAAATSRVAKLEAIKQRYRMTPAPTRKEIAAARSARARRTDGIA